MESGLHFKTMDSDDLYKKLKLIYEDKELRNKLALAGKEKANREYDNIIQFGKLKEILEKA